MAESTVEACPDENVLTAFATRGLRGHRLERIEQHLDACATCMQVVAHAASLLAREPAPDVQRIDRYAVQEELGRGGMGIVFAAWDPVLERRVALKLLRFASGRSGDERRIRLLREARAMAHLSHENVVPVFDVGQIDDGRSAFIAMELVDGTDLRHWLSRPRTPGEIWDRLIQAGRGLAAAHAAGIVHRDFKPANVLVDASGRARVSDFGLARLPEASSREGVPQAAIDGRDVASLGGDGTVLGTPAYMAPEQLRGHSDDPRIDQFSYCVALYEALVGQRPFVGQSLDELHDAIAGAPPPRPKAVMSKRVWRIVRRGLSFDPRDRWPSLDALLDALEAARRRPVRFVAAAATTAVLVVATAWWTIDERDEACLADEGWLADAWDPERKAAVQAGLLGSGTPWAPQAWGWARVTLDDWAQRWVAMRVDACRAVHERHEQTPELLDLRNACLDRRRSELATLTDALTRADAATAEAVPDAIADLTPLSVCADVDALRSVVPLPESPDDRARVSRARIALDRVARDLEAERYETGLAHVDPIVAEADALRYEPLRAEALLMRGRILRELGRFADADRDLTEAVLAGISGGDARSTATAAAERANVLSAAGDPAAALEVVKTGLSAAQTIARDADLLGALLSARGAALRRQARYEEARRSLAEVLQLAEVELGPDHPRTAAALVNLANVHAQQGRTDDARTGYERGIAIQERIYGRVHPIVANTIGNLAIASSLAGDDDRAAALGTEALQRFEAARGEDHAEVARMRSNLGVIHAQRGRFAEALSMHERALATRRRTLGDEHPDVAESLNNVGHALLELGRLEDAEAILREAWELGARQSGPAHPSVLTTRYNQARVSLARGDAEAAVAVLDEVIAIRSEVLGPDHPQVASALFELGRAHETLHHREVAAHTYTRAAALFEAAGLHDDAARARAAARG